MATLRISLEDEALARELADLVLDFARGRGLGVEHHWLKGRLSLHRGPRQEPTALAEGHANPKVIAFPLTQARHRS
jgi:hypothetical protein